MCPSCVNWRFVLGCANSGRPTLLLLLLLLFAVVAAAVGHRPSVPTVVAASVVNTCRGVWICRKWYVGRPQCHHQNADGQLRNDQAFCTEALFGIRTNNPTVRGKPRHADTKADLIFKREPGSAGIPQWRLVATMSRMSPLCSSMVSQRTSATSPRAVPACTRTW